MASTLPTLPRQTISQSIKRITRRHASSTTPSLPPPTHPLSLFKPPSSLISPWRTLPTTLTHQTTTYHYNKSTTKTLPTAAATTDALLQAYVTAIKSPSRPQSTTAQRSALQLRRKGQEKVYISESTVKDFGDRVVVKAFVFDGVEAAREERERRERERKEKRAQDGSGGRRRRTVERSGAGGAGGGARRAMGVRSAGVMGARGAGAMGARGAGLTGFRSIGPMGVSRTGPVGGGGAARTSRSPSFQRATGAGR